MSFDICTRRDHIFCRLASSMQRYTSMHASSVAVTNLNRTLRLIGHIARCNANQGQVMLPYVPWPDFWPLDLYPELYERWFQTQQEAWWGIPAPAPHLNINNLSQLNSDHADEPRIERTAIDDDATADDGDHTDIYKYIHTSWYMHTR